MILLFSSIMQALNIVVIVEGERTKAADLVLPKHYGNRAKWK